MKKLMLLMLVSVAIAASAVAQEAQTKPAQAALSKEHDKKNDLTDVTVWGVNSISGDAYLQFYNTSTSQSYYMTVHTYNSTSMSVPAGNYNITVSTGSDFCDMYVSNSNSYSAFNKYYWTFYNIDVNNVYSTVVAVEY